MPMNKLAELLRGLNTGVASNVTGPIDMAESIVNLGRAGYGFAGNKLGLLSAEQMPGLLSGSPGTTEWAKRNRLMQPTEGLLGAVGEGIGMTGPTAMAAGAGKVAKGLLQMGENALAPRMLNPQTGAVLVGDKTFVYPQDKALETARQNGVNMLGLRKGNTPMDRAKALGFDADGLHGTNYDISKINTLNDYLASKGRTQIDPFYMTHGKGQPEAEFASQFANRNPNSKEWAGDDRWTPNVMPLTMRSNDITDTRRAADLQAMRGVEPNPEMLSIGAKGLPGWSQTNNYATKASDAGLKSLMLDERSNLNSVAVFNPSVVRSRFAAFDPARVNENDLLGRADPRLLGLLGFGAGGLAYGTREKNK